MTETCKPVINHCDILTYGDLNQSGPLFASDKTKQNLKVPKAKEGT